MYGNSNTVCTRRCKGVGSLTSNFFNWGEVIVMVFCLEMAICFTLCNA
jgi:hypothetical protein